MTRQEAVNETHRMIALINRTTLDIVQAARGDESPTAGLEAAIEHAGNAICMMLSQLCKILAQLIPEEVETADLKSMKPEDLME